MKRWPLTNEDTVACAGLTSVTCGAWAKWGMAEALLLLGALLLVAYAAREALVASRKGH